VTEEGYPEETGDKGMGEAGWQDSEVIPFWILDLRFYWICSFIGFATLKCTAIPIQVRTN
jgi:hypothetical protein